MTVTATAITEARATIARVDLERLRDFAADVCADGAADLEPEALREAVLESVLESGAVIGRADLEIGDLFSRPIEVADLVVSVDGGEPVSWAAFLAANRDSLTTAAAFDLFDDLVRYGRATVGGGAGAAIEVREVRP